MANLIPDKNLKIIINKYLCRSDEAEITKSDLESIDGYIYCDISSLDRYICSVEGLQYATNITQLLIENNLLTNMEQLASLTNLTTLFLNNNLITVIPNLSNMTNLTSLLLNGNEIKDISPISTSNNLRFIKINENRVSDLSCLSKFRDLKELRATDQDIEIKDVTDISNFYTLDLSFLKDINGKTPLHISPSNFGEYDVANNRIIWDISDILLENPGFTFESDDGFFSGIVTIDLIDSDKTIVIDDEVLHSELCSILNKEDNKITLKDLLKLRFLDLSNKDIHSIKGLELASNLYTLILDGTYVTDLDNIPSSVDYVSLENLKNEVNIQDDRLKSLINMSLGKNDTCILTFNDICSLTILDEFANHINSLEGLQHATNLKILSLLNNGISDITPICNLTNLNYLDVSHNNLKDLSPLSSFYKDISYIYAKNQIINIVRKTDNNNNIFNLSLDFIKDIDGNFINDITPGQKGIFSKDNNSITWNLDCIPCDISFDFEGINNIFSGTVYIKLKSNN